MINVGLAHKFVQQYVVQANLDNMFCSGCFVVALFASHIEDNVVNAILLVKISQLELVHPHSQDF